MAGQSSALREVFASFGIDFETGALASADSAVNGVINNLRTLGNVVAGAALVQGVRSFADEMTHLGDELSDTSDMLGISSTELQEWRHVAALSGAEAGEFTGAFFRLQRRMAEGGAGLAVFRRLGVDIRDANGDLRNASDVLTDLADPIAALHTDTERTGVLMDLLGRSGARLGPLFSRGSEGIREARAELALYGGGMSEDVVAQADAVDEALHRQDVAFLSIRSRLAFYVLPVYERVIEVSTGVARVFSDMAERGYILQASLVVLGAVAVAAGANTAAAWILAAAPFVGLAAAILIATLLVEDLWSGFAGGESVIGDLGVAFEEWGNTVQGPVLQAIVTSLEFVKGIVISLTSTVWDMINAFGSLIGLGDEVAGHNLLSGIATDVGTEGNPESEAAQRILDRNRATQGGGEGTLGNQVTEFLLPDSFERFIAVQEALGRREPPARAGTTIGSIAVDARGLSEEQAQRAVERGVSDALARQTDEIVDSQGRGVS